MELGKGFAFIARRKRLTLENDHFYADLGQIQLYVNYFDQEIKAANDNPTIGLILCTEKSDAMVKYTLGEKVKQIFASKYQFHLPTEAELEAELKREIKEIKERLHDT